MQLVILIVGPKVKLARLGLQRRQKDVGSHDHGHVVQTHFVFALVGHHFGAKIQDHLQRVPVGRGQEQDQHGQGQDSFTQVGDS